MGTCTSEGCETEAKECGHCDQHCTCGSAEQPAAETTTEHTEAPAEHTEHSEEKTAEQ